MSLFRGRLFAGALFAGAVWGATLLAQPPVTPTSVSSGSGGYTVSDWHRDRAQIKKADAAAKEKQKKRLEDEAIILACMQFVLEQT